MPKWDYLAIVAALMILKSGSNVKSNANTLHLQGVKTMSKIEIMLEWWRLWHLMSIWNHNEHNEGAREQKPILQKGHIAICPQTQKNPWCKHSKVGGP